MRFQLLFTVALFASIVAACSVEGKSDKPEKVQKNASVHMDPKGKPKNVKGKLKFMDEEDITIDVEEVKYKVHLKKTDINPAKPTQDGLEVAVYAGVTDAGIVVCRHECSDKNNCRMPCIIDGEVTIYVRGNKALVISGGETETDVAVPVPDQSSMFIRKRSARFQRSLQSELTSAGVVKLMIFPDSEFMAIFLELNSYDMQEAEDDVEYFLTLIVNEMTMHYQSLKDYGLNMTRGVDGESGPLDIAIQLVHIEFPAYDSNATSFVNFDWTSNNVVNDNVFYTAFDNGTYATPGTGVLSDFKTWLQDTFNTTIAYDHAMAMTGYGLKRLRTYTNGTTYATSLAGLAYSKTLCDDRYMSSHSSIVIISSGLSRLASHELGHGIGSSHDGSDGCEAKTNIMATVFFYPSTSTEDSYYKFSNCSAYYISNHLSNINSDNFISTCLSDPTQIFLDSFCAGFSGSYSVTEQCQIKYGSTSTPLLSRVEGTAGNYYVKQCVMDPTNGQYALGCSSPNGYYKLNVADGTQCVSSDGSLADQVCFQGDCVSPPTIC